MESNGQPIMTKRDERIAKPSSLSGGQDFDSRDPWQLRLSNDRPKYECPKCTEQALQFYATHPLHPDRAEFFHCHACGNSWEM